MLAISKITKPDPYSPIREETIREQHGSKQITKVVKIEPYLCHEGDTLIVLTPNAAEWMIVVSVENKKGVRFFMRWNDLILPKKEEKDNFWDLL